MKHTASENIWKNVVLIFIGAGIALSSASAAAQKAAAGAVCRQAVSDSRAGCLTSWKCRPVMPGSFLSSGFFFARRHADRKAVLTS